MQTALLTINEVIEQLNIGRTSAYKLIKEGKLPTVYVTSHPRFRQEDVDALIQASRNY